MKFLVRLAALVLAAVVASPAQTTIATFGTRIPAPGSLLDIVLDEQRGRLYLVNYANNRLDVYSIPDQQFLTPIALGVQPVSAAMSPDGQFLYVTNYGSSTLSVIDLGLLSVSNTISLPAQPEGVAVGFDGRVLITTIGNAGGANSLLRVDPRQTGTAQLTAVSVPNPPAAPAPLTTVIPGRPFLSFRGRLQATPDGQFIIGLNSPANNSTVTFVYEAASGAVLRVRQTPGLSTVLSVSPDGSRFMAGLRMFETATLNMLAQSTLANAPFLVPGAQGNQFNLNQNVGGSVFNPDGTALYGAFNVAAFVVNPPPRPNSSTLLLYNPRNLAIEMGINLPESIVGKMVSSSDGKTVWALSESGLLMLPMGRLYEHPIIMPETTAVRLSINPCDRGLVGTEVRILNAGRGRLTFTFDQPGQNILAQAVSGLAPSSIRLSMNPRVTNRQPGTQVTNLTLRSSDAINIPPIIRVYQNFQLGGQVGETFPIEINPQAADGLLDLLVDNRRGRVYIANSGKNRVEVFDFRNRRRLPPIEAGQQPRSLAMTSDGSLLYVANFGGEWISIIDLDTGQAVGKVDFPPVPFNFNQTPITPRSIAMGIFGPQFVGSNGTLWSVRNNTAVPRAISPVIGAATVTSPAYMVSTPGGEYIILLNNSGVAYRYDSLADNFVNQQTVMSAPLDGYYGPLAAGPEGVYYLANRAILNPTLVPIGGRTTGTGAAAGGGGAAAQANQGIRQVAALAPVNDTTYARFSLPASTNQGPLGDARPLVELVDVRTEARLATIAAPEGPAFGQVGNARVNIAPRLMGVDSGGNWAFLLTMSGLTIVSLRQPDATARPVINTGGIVNGATFARNIAPGSLISIFGRNLAERATAADLPLPDILGGTCVTFNDTTLPLLSTSPTQINAQLPVDALPGTNAVVVRSIITGLESQPTLVNVSRSSPGVFALEGSQAAVFHGADMRLVTRTNPARRGEVLVLFGTGIPPEDPSLLSQGRPAPADPLVTTARPRVFLGDPDRPGSEAVVEWSGFTPGFIGLNQINLRVRDDALTGDNLVVVVRTADGESPRSGPLAPVTSVR
jgi:uncharacterized protein (TIGR03437 family)